MIRIYFIWLLLAGITCLAQDLPPVTQQQLENIAERNEEDPEDDQLLVQLEYFTKHPINLNTATQEELEVLKLLSDLQIYNLIRYRNVLGKLINIYELQAVPAWDLLTIRKILPYVMIGNAVSVSENFYSRFHKGDQSLLFRLTRVLERPKGYDGSLQNHYLGDRNHLLFRYRYQYKDLLYFGFTGDKDAGEQFFKGAQNKGFDFYSFHFFVRKLGLIKSIALGDYTVNMGQGLIQWQSLTFGKTTEVLSIKRQSPVLVPYRSAGEFYFSRGAAITLQKKNIETTVFLSYKKISGNLIKDSVEHFTGLLTSGYYRTPSEIADRNTIVLFSVGGSICYQISDLKIGFNTVAHQFDIPLQKRNEPYNYYAISGKKIFNSSVDYSYTHQNIHFFGEAAIDRNRHNAIVNGVLISADPKIDLSFLYRNIQKEYQSLFGNAFTENTLPVNEKGLYTGIAVRPVVGWQLSAYADLFRFPWLKYRVNAPGSGYDYLVQVGYQPDKQLAMYVRYKNKNKPVDSSGNGMIEYPENQPRQSLRVHLSQQLSSALSLNSRVELVWLNHQTNNSSQGFLAFVEGRYDRKKMSTTLRLQYFETGNYDSRVYAYESDVLYSVSIPAFYDKGFRYYLNLHYSITKNFEMWLRGAQTIYVNKNISGSGLDEIDSDHKSEIKAQLRYSF